MASTINLKASGLSTSPNQLSNQQGSLNVASNVIIRRDDVIEPRRGLKLYGNSFGASDDRASQLLSYRSVLLRHYNSTLEFDDGTGDFTAFSGTFSEVVAGLRIKGLETNGNFYFTTNTGIKKISAKAASQLSSASGYITQAGGIKALDVQAHLSTTLGDTSGFLPGNSAVAYRTVWGITDANKNLILGTPSQRAEVYNPLSELIAPDLNNILHNIDVAAAFPTTPTLLSQTDYLSLLQVPYNADGSTLQTNILALAAKLDADILYANDTGSGAPLNIDTRVDNFDFNPADINTGTNVITASNTLSDLDPIIFTTTDTFPSGISGLVTYYAFATTSTTFKIATSVANAAAGTAAALTTQGTGVHTATIQNRNKIASGSGYVYLTTGKVSNYLAVGSIIDLNNFNTPTGPITGQHTISFVSPQVVDSFLPAAVNTGTDLITITAHGLVANNLVHFTNVGGGLPAPLTAGTDYFISATGLTANAFSVSATADGAVVNLTTQGTGIHTVQTPTYISFVTSQTGTVTSGTSSTITSGEYESITSTGSPDFPTSLQDTVVDTPATANELGTIQDTLSRILSRLKEENAFVIDPTALATFIDPLNITTSSNVTLTFTIPDAVTVNDFYQVYRSAIVTATGATVLTDLTPSDEMQLVYEAFPTPAEITAQQVTFTDVTPDAFRGANLYTNASTGEGILQANDVPPAAHDINKFKNYTFYANTRTLQRLSINLLGVQHLIDLYNSGITPVITIATANGSTTFNFKAGLQEVTNFYGNDASIIAASTYFTVNSANDVREYYFWFRKDGLGTDPLLPGKVGVVVDIKTGDTYINVSNAISASFATANIDFFVSQISASFTSANVDTGADTITVTASGLLNKDVVQFTTTGSLPTGISALTYYYLKNVVDNGDGTETFQISTTPTGGAVNITTAGTGTQTMSTAPGVSRVFNVDEGDTTDATSGSSGITPEVVQQGTGQNTSTFTILLSNQASVALAVDATARSLVHVINLSTSDVYAYYLSGAGDVPGKILLEARTLGATDNPFYVMANSDLVGSSFNPDISPLEFINPGTSILKDTPTSGRVAINLTAHGFINGDQVMISGSQDATPALSIDGIYTVTRETNDQFSIAATIASNAVVVMNSIGVTLLEDVTVSDDEVRPNRIYYSKLQQPEAVPLVNTIDLGAQDKAILRIVPLRDSLFVFKEDGLFRISGEVAPFSVSLFDVSCLLKAPDSIGTLNNIIYAWTRKGIENISESGITTISRPIDVDILPLASSGYPNFTTATWGIGYESDNSYIVGTVTQITDTVATILYRYSNLTNSWTTFDKTNTCGIISPADDKLYMGAGDTNFIEQERKNFDRTDYADREITKSIVSNAITGNGYNIRFADVSELAVGDVITQDQLLTTYEYNALLQKLDLDPGTADKNYYSSLLAIVGDNLRTKIIALATKLDADAGVSFSNYAQLITGDGGSYSTSITSVSINNPTVITTAAAHGLYSITGPSEGRFIDITGLTTNADITGEYEITRTGATTFTIPVNVISVADGVGSFVRLENSFADIKSCYDIIINNLNNDPSLVFTNYSRTNTTTLQEVIITNINVVTKVVTVNLALDFLMGPVTIYKKIVSEFEYAPQTMGDPLGFKQLREATVMFENKAFTSATVSFGTDLLPAFVDVNFDADSNGIFGHGKFFGSGFFGGAGNSAPFRTYIPAPCQRCRYIVVAFNHGIAREKYSVFGVSITGEIGLSTRAYK